MNFELPEDDRLLCQSVAELCAQSVTPDAPAWDEAGAVPPAVLQTVAELGLFGLVASADEGGAGLSWVAAAAVLEELAVGDASLAALVAIHGLVALPTLQAAGDVDEAYVTGSRRLTAALVGSGVVASQSEAGWSLQGQTDWLVGAGLADDALLLADAGGDPGWPVCLRVPLSDAGVSRDASSRPLGMRAAAWGRPSLAGVTVSDAARVGEVGGAPSLVEPMRTRWRLAVAAIAVGVQRRALEVAGAYAREREQFGRPIAAFQAIQWKLADAAVALDSSRLLTRRAAWCLDAGRPAEVLAAHAKLAATMGAARFTSEALQIHGGYGYTVEYPVERLLRDAKRLEAADGTNRTARDVVARASLVTRG